MNGSAPEVAALARQVTRLRWLTILLGAGLVALCISVAAKEREGNATEEVVVRDAQGNVRTRLHAEGLSILDEKGTPRAQLMLNDGTARLILFGPQSAQIQMAVAEDGTEGLYFFDRRLRQRARVSLQDNDTVGFTLFDQNFIWRVIMAVTSEGRPSLTLFDAKGRTIARMPPEEQKAAPEDAQ